MGNLHKKKLAGGRTMDILNYFATMKLNKMRLLLLVQIQSIMIDINHALIINKVEMLKMLCLCNSNSIINMSAKTIFFKMP